MGICGMDVVFVIRLLSEKQATKSRRDLPPSLGFRYVLIMYWELAWFAGLALMTFRGVAG
jgi:hypothetical protein